MRSQQDS
jgi:RNA-directed DNA polymerase